MPGIGSPARVAVLKEAAISAQAAQAGADLPDLVVLASDESEDRHGDIIRAAGWDLENYRKNPIVLWAHNHSFPVGTAELEIVGKRLLAKIKLAKAGTSTLVDFVREMIAQKILRAVSVSFLPKADPAARLDEKGRFLGFEYNGQELIELSIVSVGSNPAALSLAKSFPLSSAERAAAFGGRSVYVRSGAAGLQSSKGAQMSKLAAHLAQLREKSAALAVQMDDIAERVAVEGRTMTDEEAQTYDAAVTDRAVVESDIARLEKTVSLTGGAAAPAPAAPAAPAADGGAGRIVERMPGAPGNEGARRPFIAVENNREKGIAFARFVKAIAVARGNPAQALEIVRDRCRDAPEVLTCLKAAVAAGTTSADAWAKPLVEYQIMSGELIDLLRPQTIVGRLQGLRRVPFRIKVPRKTAGASVGWVGEGKPKPVSKLGFDTVALDYSKIAGIVVITDELARDSSPAAEGLVRDDMVETIAEFTDRQFIDPEIAANAAAESPASITNGVVAIPSSGDTIADITADVKSAYVAMVNANMRLTDLAWVMNPRTKISLGMMRTAQDVLAFPEVNASGTFRGFPIIDSTSVSADGGDLGGETFMALVAPREIMLADDGSVSIDASREAAIAMSDDGTGALTSLWQNNLMGIRAERAIHWLKRRAQAVQVISGVTY